MSSPRRVLALISWLVVAGLILRIAIADNLVRRLANPVPVSGVLAIGVGLVLLAAAVVLVAGFAKDSPWSWRFSRAAGVVAVPFGLSLLVGSHESGSLISLAAIAGLLAVTLGRGEIDRPD